MTDRAVHYKNLEALVEGSANIAAVFKAEPSRLENFVMREGPLRADFSKQAMSEAARRALLSFAAQCDLEEWRAKLFAGEKVNTSEGRAVLHLSLIHI